MARGHHYNIALRTSVNCIPAVKRDAIEDLQVIHVSSCPIMNTEKAEKTTHLFPQEIDSVVSKKGT